EEGARRRPRDPGPGRPYRAGPLPQADRRTGHLSRMPRQVPSSTVRLRKGPADVPEILDLVARTAPGPFLKRTVELGTCLGIRDRGRLIAMAGERSEMGVPPAGGWGRIHPPGWTEISAVCTDPHHRGRGLATRLVRAVAAGIRDRGETPFLHAAADNVTAIRLYESIGFTLRRRSTTVAVRSPGAPRDRAVRTS
ncbi:GNAT family N-acetyltransferase, partial [Streptomyces scabiei]|uniref:GNAT family N-acetyltransferase n=1 Tax=Streptomyces scabiei TaxID=1930 RepID=UPI0038D36714